MINFNITGEQKFFFKGAAGELEASINIPTAHDFKYIALIGHPHSQHGGSMNNKVVTTLVRVFHELNIPSIRFNFRGVGNSKGKYDDGIGESIDMQLLTELCQKTYPEIKFIFSGFSFGSYVAYRAYYLCNIQDSILISIAPPVNHFNFKEYEIKPPAWIIVQGLLDEVVPTEEVISFIKQEKTPIIFLDFPNTGHFFHGKLINLKSTLINTIKSCY